LRPGFAPRVTNVPFQPWAKEVYDFRQKSQVTARPPYIDCKAAPGPEFLLAPGFEIVDAPEVKSVFIMNIGGPHSWRVIYTDGRPHPKPEDLRPTYLGHSIGHWEGDTLVVDTVGMNDKTYVDSYRTPHTDMLHVVEHFRMIDGGKTMEAKVHVEDPGAFTTPWDALQLYRRIDASGDKTDPRVPRGPLEEMACAENNGDRFNEGLDPIPTADRPDF
jgi:hypothetical protein